MLRWSLTGLAGIGVMIIVLALLILEREPSVQVSAHKQLNGADTLKPLLNRLDQLIDQPEQFQTITLAEEQLNSLSGFVQRALPGLHSQFLVKSERVGLQTSYPLVLGPWQFYLNVRADVVAGEGFTIGQLSLGSLPLPGNALLSLSSRLFDGWFNSALAEQTLQQVLWVETQHQSVNIGLRPMQLWLQAFHEFKNQLPQKEPEWLARRTGDYLLWLTQLPQHQLAQASSLSDFFKPLFDYVEQQSGEDNVREEMTAAVMALAIYAGHHRVENLVGELPVQASPNMLKPRYYPMLAGRRDLCQHYLVSAAITLSSAFGVSLAVGEFKELMDRGMGGSGYSFVDLTADMAGTRLGQLITESGSPKAVLAKLREVKSDRDLLPATHGLPEGFSKKAFTQSFGEVDSPAYQAMVKEVESRIDKIALYRDAAPQS